MPALSTELRSTFEREVIGARDTAEAAARAALTTLAVERDRPFDAMSEEQRALRRALRARARQLGEGDMVAGIPRLIEEVAYEQWHRMLFARFLAQNDLLMHPEGIAVTLEECAELAQEEGGEDLWAVATRCAGAMLPGIFRGDDPALQVRFAPEGRRKLEQIVTDLPRAVFTSDDGLGWAYQFWQSKKKAEVKASERRIGGTDIPAVTQLFTEEYMVKFLLHNSLGAWWAHRHPDSPLNSTFEYLRYRDDGIPAAGTFDGWPDQAADVTMMDPCCGSGHFLVASCEMLTQMRIEEEGLDIAAASDAVIQDNLFGLELDPRCTQIAAFNLALTAWKAGGYRELPLPNIACCGIPVKGHLEHWVKLAAENEALQRTLERLHHLFRNAPDLGSLINPAQIPVEDRMFVGDLGSIVPLIEYALHKSKARTGVSTALFGGAAAELARAASLLRGKYTLVATNVPYLGRNKQAGILQVFAEQYYPDSKTDLATVFIERIRDYTSTGGSYSVVAPQNWLFLRSYRRLRKTLLQEQEWNVVARLGPQAFRTPMYDFNVSLFIFSNQPPVSGHLFVSLDASVPRNTVEKARLLLTDPAIDTDQLSQLKNEYSVVSLASVIDGPRLADYVSVHYGSKPGQTVRVTRRFWELPAIDPTWWTFMASTPDGSAPYSGKSKICLSFQKIDELGIVEFGGSGRGAWGRPGVIVSKMNRLPSSLYSGEFFDDNTYALIPKDPAHIAPVYHYVRSREYYDEVRKRNQKVAIDTSSMINVPFDIERWLRIAHEEGPLPEPQSNDPTQWVFSGNPNESTDPLQVATARLLGFRWTPQVEDGLTPLADEDGIVCLPSVIDEPRAHERLRALLAAAFSDKWPLAREHQLLAKVQFRGQSLAAWLHDGFFEQHCKRFKNRPFIWHIWDGRKDSFSALVNYHKLDHARLERLIYTYLGDWINTQRAEQERGAAGAEGRLVAALELKKKLELILEGEPPYDIYIRWNPLHEQPIGWNPDLNDGVRLNIRPFVKAGVLRSKFTIHWKKDRGKNPDGSARLNDLHVTRAEKLRAQEAVLRRR